MSTHMRIGNTLKKSLVGLSLALLPACSAAPEGEFEGEFEFEAVDVHQEALTGPINALPDPLYFPDVTVGDGVCGSGGKSCTYAMVTLTNTTSVLQTIASASATSPFWVTWGGTCNNAANAKKIQPGKSCTLQFGFKPLISGKGYAGTGTVNFASGIKAQFTLRGRTKAVTASPNPLVFPNATVGTGACGSAGAACTYATVTLTNETGQDEKIATATAPSPFWVTWGGTCNSNKIVPKGGSCTLQFGFKPTARGTAYSSIGYVNYESGSSTPVPLRGTSN